VIDSSSIYGVELEEQAAGERAERGMIDDVQVGMGERLAIYGWRTRSRAWVD